jgi:multidrug efflux system membrane fusion protein
LTDKKLRLILPFAIVIVGVVATMVMLKSRAPVATRPPDEYAPLVRVVVVEPQTHRLTVTTYGTVKPRTETALVSEVAGRVMSIAPSLASGGYFEKGEVMLTVDARDYELAVVTAQGLVAQAKVRAELEEAQGEVAREEWKTLGGDKVSPLATRELQLQEAQAALAAAEASLEVARRNLRRTRVRAPFACRVRDKRVDVGQYVTPGAPVAGIYAIDYVEIRLPIPDAELAFLDLPFNYRGEKSQTQGPEVRLHADFAGAHRQWVGRIVRVEGEIDPVSRVVHAVAQVDDPYGRKTGGERMPLAVGLFVQADIVGLEVDDAVALPRSAVRGGNTVLVVDDDDQIRFREIHVLRLSGNTAIVTGGLSRGEKVCISSLEAVTDGMKVRTALSPPQPGPADEIGDSTTTLKTGDDS